MKISEQKAWRRARLAALMSEFGPQKLSSMTGLATGYLHQMSRSEGDKARPVNDTVAAKIEAAIERPGWFSPLAQAASGLNIEPGPAIDVGSAVPLISWVAAGSWSTVSDPYPVGDADIWYPRPRKCGPRTFALRVRGISMQNPTGKPSFEHGDIIFVDPDVYPTPNTRAMTSCVVVRLDDSQESTFKQLIEEGGRRYLKPLNPAWPEPIIEMNGNATLCGTVIGKWVE